MIKTLPYVIKNTKDFFCRLKDHPDNAIVYPMSVIGLYPHISWGWTEQYEGPYSVVYRESQWFDMNIEAKDKVDLAEFILNNNYLEFESNFYRQKLGTAIGTITLFHD